MPATMLAAAVLGAILLILSIRVTTIRRSDRIAMGDGGNPALIARMRAQANCAEYAPMGLILLALAERQFGPQWFVVALAALLVAGRIVHPIGMAMQAPNAPRVLGMVGTWTAIGLLVPLVAWGAFQP